MNLSIKKCKCKLINNQYQNFKNKIKIPNELHLIIKLNKLKLKIYKKIIKNRNKISKNSYPLTIKNYNNCIMIKFEMIMMLFTLIETNLIKIIKINLIFKKN